MRILIFDSGVGGLSIYEEIRQRLPQANFTYLFDNLAFPYGELSSETLVDRATSLIQQVVDNDQCDLVVVACNTASTIVLPPLRCALSIPVVGVVPAIKPAAQNSQTKNIGLLATPATVNRPYTEGLIREFASDCRVVRVGSTALVKMAEDKLRGITPDKQALMNALTPFIGTVDQLILGCTHFPLLKGEIAEIVGEEVQVIDSGTAIANRVYEILGHSVSTASIKRGDVYCTLIDEALGKLTPCLHALGFNSPALLSI